MSPSDPAAIARVPLYDVPRGEQPLWPALEDAFRRVLQSGRYVLGAEVEAFERACAEALGVRHAIGTSSGTDALLLALMTIGIGPGDEVCVPAFTFFATAGVVARLGARPVFCDIDSETFNLCPRALADALTGRTRAVIPVHLFGQAADMDAIVAACAPRGIAVIEDAAQALGATYGGRPVGGLGDMGCFSFYPTKNVGGFGDAGLLTTGDDDLAARARILRVHGDRGGYDHVAVGGNFRLDAVQAALLAVKLPHLEAWNEGRRGNAAVYRQALAELGAFGRGPEEGTTAIDLPAPRFERHAYNQLVVRVRGGGRRDALKAHLEGRGIGTAIYYPRPLHLQPCFAALGYAEGDLPAAEAAARECLALPVFPALTEAEIRHVCRAIAAFTRG